MVVSLFVPRERIAVVLSVEGLQWFLLVGDNEWHIRDLTAWCVADG